MSPADLDYVVNSGAWSIGGGLIGYVIGRAHARLRGIERHLENLDPEEDTDDHP